MKPMSVLDVQNLVVEFPTRHGTLRALDHVSFQIQRGEILGVVGESGCGKSTTARLLMNLIAPDQGDIVFDGSAVGGRDLPMKDFRRQAQMVFQDSYASLNPRLTIEDSIAFAPQVHGLSRAESVERARDLLSRVLDIVMPADRECREPWQIADDHFGGIDQLDGELTVRDNDDTNHESTCAGNKLDRTLTGKRTIVATD